jgi:hypothetical protein
VAVGLSLSGGGRGEEGSYALEFLTVGVGARAAAMGNAHVAVADDATAAYWNPAGLAAIRRRAFAAQHADTFQQGPRSLSAHGLVQYNFANVAFPFEHGAKVAVSWVRMGIDGIPRVTFEDVNGDGVLGTYLDRNLNGRKDPGEYYVDRPVVAEAFANTDQAVLVSYARHAAETLAVGGTLKLVRQSLYVNHGTGVGADVGVVWRIGRHLRAGAVVQDVAGTRVRWDTPSRPTFTRHWNLRLGIAAGSATRLISLLAAADMDVRRTTRLSEDVGPSRWHAGVEMTLLRTAALRVGFDAGAFTAGAGFRIPLGDAAVAADYAFTTHPDLGDGQRLSLTGAF